MDDTALPEKWNTSINKSMQKARNLLNKTIGIKILGTIIVGKLMDVETDRLYHLKFPYCKVLVKNSMKFRESGELTSTNDIEVFFISKPEMILSEDELERHFPEILANANRKLRTADGR